jgi:ubiquinone/menaquinone biosynthesis C-methylase UbiE
MARVMVEQAFDEPMTDEKHAAFAKRLDPCLDLRNGTWRRSSLALDKLRLICEFEAPDAESVREAFRAAAIPIERAWTAEVFAVEDYPERRKKLDVLLGKKTASPAPPGAAAVTDSNEEATAAWNGVLFDKFERFRDVLTNGFTRHSDAALERHPVASGWQVLDVGCGFGDVTSRLARAVGSRGVACGVDVAARFVDWARADAKRAGLENAQFLRADVQADRLGGPYDVIFSRFGVMFFASPVAAMRNLRRALKPGGRLCMVVWRKREDNPWVHVAEKVVRDLVPERHDTGEPTCGPGPFSMSSADVTGDILQHAGFSHISFERNDAPVCIGRDVDQAIEFAMSLGPAGEVMRLAGDEGDKQRPAVMAALRAALARYVQPEGVVMPSSTWIVTGAAGP